LNASQIRAALAQAEWAFSTLISETAWKLFQAVRGHREDFEFTRLGIFPVYTFHILFSFTLSISFQLKLQTRRFSHYVCQHCLPNLRPQFLCLKVELVPQRLPYAFRLHLSHGMGLNLKINLSLIT
jgi:hypothetical protein